MAFSLTYSLLHEVGIANLAEGLSVVEAVERRSWVRVLHYRDDPVRYRRATKEQRKAFLAAYPELIPTWDPDVDYGEPNLHVEITDQGKAEWRRRHPLERRNAWRCEGHPSLGAMTVWAIDENLADWIAGPPTYASRHVEPATFELNTGDVIVGVKGTYRWLNPDATTPDANRRLT
jgi:hypothetical protein